MDIKYDNHSFRDLVLATLSKTALLVRIHADKRVTCIYILLAHIQSPSSGINLHLNELIYLLFHY